MERALFVAAALGFAAPRGYALEARQAPQPTAIAEVLSGLRALPGSQWPVTMRYLEGQNRGALGLTQELIEAAGQPLSARAQDEAMERVKRLTSDWSKVSDDQLSEIAARFHLASLVLDQTSKPQAAALASAVSLSRQRMGKAQQARFLGMVAQSVDAFRGEVFLNTGVKSWAELHEQLSTEVENLHLERQGVEASLTTTQMIKYIQGTAFKDNPRVNTFAVPKVWAVYAHEDNHIYLNGLYVGTANSRVTAGAAAAISRILERHGGSHDLIVSFYGGNYITSIEISDKE